MTTFPLGVFICYVVAIYSFASSAVCLCVNMYTKPVSVMFQNSPNNYMLLSMPQHMIEFNCGS